MAKPKTSGRAPRPQFTCENCAKDFTVYPSKLKAGPSRFCTYACCVAHRRRTGIWPTSRPPGHVTCETCGKVKEIPPSHAVTARFCSQACMIVWRRPITRVSLYKPETHTTTTCGWCEKTFATRWCILRSGRGKYCSRQCRAAYSANRCQNRVSGAETRFGDALRAVGLDPVAQHRLGRWSVDFYFPSFGIAVEFDGEYWHSLPSAIDRDARKAAALAKHRLRLVRVPERLWIDDPDAAVRLVVAALNEVKAAMGQPAITI